MPRNRQLTQTQFILGNHLKQLLRGKPDIVSATSVEDLEELYAPPLTEAEERLWGTMPEAQNEYAILEDDVNQKVMNMAQTTFDQTAVLWRMMLLLYRQSPYQILSHHRGLPYGTTDLSLGFGLSSDAARRLADAVGHPLFATCPDGATFRFVLWVVVAHRIGLSTPCDRPPLLPPSSCDDNVILAFRARLAIEQSHMSLGQVLDQATAAGAGAAATPLQRLVRHLITSSTTPSATTAPRGRSLDRQALLFVKTIDIQELERSLDAIGLHYTIQDVHAVWPGLRGNSLLPRSQDLRRLAPVAFLNEAKRYLLLRSHSPSQPPLPNVYTGDFPQYQTPSYNEKAAGAAALHLDHGSVDMEEELENGSFGVEEELGDGLVSMEETLHHAPLPLDDSLMDDVPENNIQSRYYFEVPLGDQVRHGHEDIVASQALAALFR